MKKKTHKKYHEWLYIHIIRHQAAYRSNLVLEPFYTLHDFAGFVIFSFFPFFPTIQVSFDQSFECLALFSPSLSSIKRDRKPYSCQVISIPFPNSF